jgi:putative transposase
VNIVDHFTKKCLAIDVDASLPGRRVVSVRNGWQTADGRGSPYSVTAGNGP